jgi:hypothetical protein
MSNIKRTIGLVAIFGWPVLGFYRGLKSYDYNYSNNRLYRHSEKMKFPLYIDKSVWGIGGMLWYSNPVGFILGLYKEVYRLEVNLRGLEDEKKTAYYNEVH